MKKYLVTGPYTYHNRRRIKDLCKGVYDPLKTGWWVPKKFYAIAMRLANTKNIIFDNQGKEVTGGYAIRYSWNAITDLTTGQQITQEEAEKIIHGYTTSNCSDR